jgi:dihydrofolate synthase/folylpolyglutamate synthase
MKYQKILDYIYEDFMSVKYKIKEKDDSQIRNPYLLVNLMHKIGIIPESKKIIKVTGSKGKGTTARICENMIRASLPNAKVAMLISPEEIYHNDRMRVNNIPITTPEFEKVFLQLKPELDELKKSFGELDYLSPSGLFVLIAFYWWKNQDIDYFILETGRGAKYDEVGVIPAFISIVTSILLEHTKQLGTNCEKIAEHKLFVCDNSDYCVLGETVLPYYKDYKAQKINSNTRIQIKSFPKWYESNCELALPAVAKLLNKSTQEIKNVFDNFNNKNSASFGYTATKKHNYYFESAISFESLDIDLIQSLSKQKTLFLLSLPDDKDINNIVQKLNKYGDVKHIVLSGTRGYLNYDITQQKYSNQIIWKGQYNDKEDFKTTIKNLDYINIYFIGTQTYTRLVKQSFFGY